MSYAIAEWKHAMSRLGKKPISVPAAVKITVSGGKVSVSGPKGNLEWTAPGVVSVKHDAGAKQITVDRSGEDKHSKAMHGTARMLIANMITGVAEGYTRGLEVYGTGYSVKVEGQKLVLAVGFAHTVPLEIPKGVKVDIEVAQTKGNETPAKFSISGPDKQVVGQFARAIKDARPPEPYQGKGIRYAGEQIKRKQGKAFAGGAAGG